LQSEYEKLTTLIDDADDGSLVLRAGEFAESFLGADRSNHSTIIKVCGIKLVELTATFMLYKYFNLCINIHGVLLSSGPVGQQQEHATRRRDPKSHLRIKGKES
jgi:hypothetical protein